MSKMPSPRADALQAMREARWQKEQDRQAAERKAERAASPPAPRSREPAKPVKRRSK